MAEEGLLGSVGGLMQGGGTGNFDVVSLGGTAVNALTIMFQVLIGLVVFGALIYFVYRFMMFNVDVELKKIKDGVVIDILRKRARKFRSRKTGVEGLKIAGVKRLQLYPAERFKQRKGRHDFYEGILDVNGNVHWIELTRPTDKKEAFLEPMPMDYTEWVYQRDLSIESRYRKQSMIEKYQQVLLPIAALMFVAIVLFFFFQYVGKGTESMAGAFSNMAKECSSLLK